MFIKRIIDYIAKYYVELNGCDAIIFTAGIAENSSKMRRDVINGLNILGIKVDEKRNNSIEKETKISSDDSSVPCYVIATAEEVMIARDTYDFLK